jgi:hypothetical protein
MNRSLSTAFAGLLMLLPIAAQAGESDRTLVIFNKTRSELRELYTSPMNSEIWGADQLGTQRIGVGGKVSVNLSNDAGECVFDLLMVFEDGEKVKRRANVCRGGSLTITEHKEDISLPST